MVVADHAINLTYAIHILNIAKTLLFIANILSKHMLNNRNLPLTARLLKQGYRYYHEIRKFQTLLQQVISEPIFYGDLVYITLKELL